MTWSERSMMAQAFLLMPLVTASLRLFGFKKTYHWLYTPTPPRKGTNVAPASQSVDVAARNLPLYKPTCLSRSLVLWHLLRRRESAAELRIGVNTSGGRFTAHAWVESDNQVVNDAPDIAQRFQPIDISYFSNKGQL